MAKAQQTNGGGGLIGKLKAVAGRG
jgi:hypothetical protein